jgi:hypothetical protein
MGFLELSIIVLASMTLLLAGMVGYLYFQQSRLVHALNGLGHLVGTLTAPPVEEEESSDDESEDDRASVEAEKVPEVEVVELPEHKSETTGSADVDVDDLQNKTASELRDILSKKGIPFGKRDAKTVLVQLLKATA